jgi:hypothetical protein
MIKKARECYQESLKVYKKADFPHLHNEAKKDLKRLERIEKGLGASE